VHTTSTNKSGNVNSPEPHQPKTLAALGIVLLLCLPAALVVGLFHTAKPQLLGPGDQAPAFNVTSIGVDTLERVAFGRHPTALLFFSTDCPHCIREVSNFDQLHRRFGATISFLAISTSSGKKTAEFLKKQQFDVPTKIDVERRGIEAFGVDVVPALFLVGSNGIIFSGESGEKNSSARERLFLDFTNTIAPGGTDGRRLSGNNRNVHDR
jgi:peroxiredoxin